MLVVVGILALLGSACGAIVSVMPFEELAKQQPETMKLPPGVTFNMLRAAGKTLGIGGLIVGAIELVLAAKLRRGRQVIMAGLILNVLLAGFFGLGTAVIVSRLGVAPPAIFYLIITAVFIFQVKLLAVAYRDAPQGMQAEATYQQQYTEYLQQQQAYQQQYGTPPPMNYTPYGPGAYNAPATGTAGTNTAQTGWVWQPPAGAIPPPPEPPKDESHGQGSQG